MPMSLLNSHNNILEKELNKMQHRNPSQLHASMYMEEDITTDKRRTDAGSRKNAKTVNTKSGGKKK
jgi:hypothetical protein